jgi:hypothetical protein
MFGKSILSNLVRLVFVGVTLSSCTASSFKHSSEENPSPIEFEQLVEFDREVHFLTPNGQDVVLPPGSYTVKAFGEGLRFASVDREGTDSITVQGKSTTHEASVTKPEPVIIKGDDDQQFVILLMPAGKAIEAVGSNSGVFSRHPHPPIIKPGAFSGLKLPGVKSILATPPPPAYGLPPPGNITPFGTLYIKGALFGPSQGKVVLHVNVPVDKYFSVSKGTVSLPGTKAGTRRLQLEVEKWSQDRITAKMPLVSGVPDHSAVLQILNSQGVGGPGFKVPFYATRARTTLQFGENVAIVTCSVGANRGVCLEHNAIDPALTLEGPCFYGGPQITDKTISAWHLNCHAIIDWDKGTDQYAVKLKNNWAIEEIRSGWKASSTSEKFNLPSSQSLTKKYKGASSINIFVPWEVSPGPDWLSYWIDVDVKGPAGVLYGNRVYWKK